MGKSAHFKSTVQWNSVLTQTSASLLTLAGHKHRCQDKAAENPLYIPYKPTTRCFAQLGMSNTLNAVYIWLRHLQIKRRAPVFPASYRQMLDSTRWRYSSYEVKPETNEKLWAPHTRYRGKCWAQVEVSVKTLHQSQGNPENTWRGHSSHSHSPVTLS